MKSKLSRKYQQVTKVILQDFLKSIKRNIERRRKELQAILKTEYDHDCHAGPDDGCQTCEWIENASLEELLAKVEKFEEEKDKIRADHLEGDYEPPTPSDTQDAIDNFGVEPDVHGRSNTGEIL